MKATINKQFFGFVFITAFTLSIQHSTLAETTQFRAADVQECIQKLSSDSPGDRSSAGEALSEMGPAATAAVPMLIQIVELDPVMSVRGEAAKALGNIGPQAASATEALVKFVNNKDGGIERAYAATALGNIRARADIVVPTLTAIVRNDDQPVVRQLSARALGDFGSQATPAVSALIQAIKTTDKDLRDAALDSLVHIPVAESDVQSLIELLSDELSAVRGAAAKALASAASNAALAVPALTNVAQNDDYPVRAAAIESLGSIGKDAKSALPALQRCSKDPALKEQALKSIKLIKSAK